VEVGDRHEEGAGGEHVQEAVPALAGKRVVQARGRLERDALLVEERVPVVGPVPERQLDVGLPREPLQPALPARLDGLDAESL